MYSDFMHNIYMQHHITQLTEQFGLLFPGCLLSVVPSPNVLFPGLKGIQPSTCFRNNIGLLSDIRNPGPAKATLPLGSSPFVLMSTKWKNVSVSFF